MPSSYSSSSSYNARTYGRKFSAKRKGILEDMPDEGSDILQVQPRKRRKVSVEVPESTTPSKERQGSQEVLTDTEKDSTSSPPRKNGSVLITYGSPKRKPKSPSPPLRTPQRNPIPAKDLTSIFQTITPTRSSPTLSPTKLAKRMLARSKTDSSIDGHGNPSRTLFERFERTPSLPNLPSSSPPRETRPSSSQDALSLPVPVPVTTRTYAGKSRSFLVAIPTSNLTGSNSLFPGGVEEEEDEYSTRESYASLRTRWGVDNSEDDPYPLYPTASPSRSDTTSTPSGSPKKSGKGKGKGKGGTTREGQSLVPVQPPLPNGMMNPLKSITELRSKGESRRFLDEVGYLFEGMESSGGIGLRRASALEITTKLCDGEFSRKAKAADFLGRIWDVFGEAGAGRGEDKILDALLAFFAALVARDPASLTDLGTTSASVLVEQKLVVKRGTSPLVDTLFTLLANSADPLASISSSPKEIKVDQDAEFRKMGVGKKDRMLFATIHKTIISSSLFSRGTHISTSLLLTYALQVLPPSLLSTRHFPELLTSLRKMLSAVISPSSSYLSWPDAAYTISYENIYNHLRLLDTYLLGQWSDFPSTTKDELGSANDDEKDETRDSQNINDRKLAEARDEWLADALVALSVCAEIDGGRPARKCAEILFRALVSLTHGDEMWAGKVVENESALLFLAREIAHCSKRIGRSSRLGAGVDGEWTVKNEEKGVDEQLSDEGPDGDEQTQSLDRLCLALGLLTNLVQTVGAVKDLLRDIRLDPLCTLKKRTCIRQCTCSYGISSLSMLDILVKLYIDQLPPAQAIKSESTPPIDTADASFLRGHLAVMFGLLMRDSLENQEYILNALDGTGGGASSRAKLNRLVDQARDFVAFYAALSSHTVDSDMPVGHGGPDGGRELDAERERESNVAKGVVRFLERLRDDIEV